MNLFKRNITVIILLTAIISTLSVSFYAIEIQDGSNLDSVTILNKEFEHQAMTAYLRTTSDTVHYPHASAGCYECPDSVVGWTSRTDDYPGAGEKDVRVIKRYPYSCWQHRLDSSHVSAFFDVYFE